MDYWPNVDAVQWFCDDVFPALSAQDPALRFYIVGARPASAVLELAKQPNIVVTGTVPDVRPYIRHAQAAVAPLRIARGIQNKVLEAMAMAVPTVVSPQALEGIDAVADRELAVADGAPAWVATLAALLARDNRDMGRAARARVEHHYSWPSNLACIEERLECS